MAAGAYRYSLIESCFMSHIHAAREGQQESAGAGDYRASYASMATLMRQLMNGRRFEQMFDFSAFDQRDPYALMRLSMLFDIGGNRTMAAELQAKALQLRQLYHLAAPRAPAALRLLAILKRGYMRDNMPFDFLLEDSDVACDLLYVAPDLPLPETLPEHDVLLVAIGQVEQERALFDWIAPILAQSTRPVLNRPGPVCTFGRDRISALLQSIPGLQVPPTCRLEREALQRLACGDVALPACAWPRADVQASWPLIVRPVASHAGEGLARIEQAGDLAAYLERQPEQAFYLTPFIDYRSADGLYRKCRLVLMRGRPAMVCHLAISEHWMVHYQSAGMSASADKRAEEARFMAGFDGDFFARHGAALSQIGARMDMDYLVLDCGETPAGDLLFFEADNISLIHMLDNAELFPYKQHQMRKVFQVFRDLLEETRAS